MAALRAHRARQAQERLAWETAWTNIELVFTREDGTALSPVSMSQTIERLARKAGVPVIRFHDLRHTNASLSLLANQHPAVVAARLGHSVTMLLETYSHVLETVASDAASEVAGLVIGKALTIR
ncbi:MAG TPA: tyrosine-type recombinase/integrase [Acidimicrobiales bacterium]